MAWTRLIQSARAALGTAQSCSTLGLPRFHSSKPATYFVLRALAVPEFSKGQNFQIQPMIGGNFGLFRAIPESLNRQCDLDMVSNLNLVLVKVGIPEFLGGIGRGAETHIAKIETEIGDLHKLLVTRTLRLKKLGIPCKHRKLILKYGQKYRLGLWKPRADAIKA
ncbi:unknown protein [Arabidopsis thaliana]|uniref:F10A16.10 protein n=1 Tax=Arabidopsis thaliana TaxID=3702 RepID=Q9M9L5_ARATH|nr:unknown protein [Arabidopsis thaliana]